jgi:hypothetical protein
MVRARRVKAWGLLATGLIVGLSIGGALALGVWAGGKRSAAPGLGELKLHAMASHGAETFAIATGPIDEGVEGLFTLDFLTGDLQCYIINPRTGGLGGWFKTNIAKDLDVEKGKKPSYLIATGEFMTTGGAYGNVKAAGCICYIVDANSGQVAAYTFPWARGSVANNVPQSSEMKLIYKWKARDLALRE